MTEKELYWQKRIDEQRSSGLSGRRFCTQSKLGYASFLSWRRRLAAPTDFVQLPEIVSIDISCGAIKLSTNVDIGTRELSRLIVALHSAAQTC
jgi:hypothetical protein